MIRNMDTDPNGLLIRYKWGGRYERRSDGKGTYYGDGNAYMGTVRTHLAVRDGGAYCPIVRWGLVTPMTSCSQWEVAA